MAEMMAVLGALTTKLVAGATAAGSFLTSPAGMAIGTGLTAASTIYGGVQANQDAKVESKYLKEKGDQEFSSAQRESMRRRRETALVVSRQKAIAGASGGAVTDPTVQSVMEKTTAEGEYSAMMDMYNGTISRANLNAEAASVKRSGKRKLVSSFLDAGSTIYGDIAKRRQPSYDSLY